jgi:hypothetical protein
MAIVTHSYRPKRALRRKPKATPLTVPRIVKAPTKGERAQRREEAEPARATSPEEEAKVMDLLRRMMRPR